MREVWLLVLKVLSGLAALMMNELLAIDLMILTVCQALLVWHCFEWRKERPQIMDALHTKAKDLNEILTEYGHLMADIADMLDTAPPAGPKVPSGGGIGEALLGALISRTQMRSGDGEEKSTVRQIHEGQFTEAPEQMEGGDFGSEPSDDLHTDGRSNESALL